jgi:hypothetical protein
MRSRDVFKRRDICDWIHRVADSGNRPFRLPERGDGEVRLTLEGVGRVVTAWESVELELSRLYSIFAGDSDGAPMQEYGKARIFIDRVKSLEEIGARAFILRPNQSLEGNMRGLLDAAKAYSDRRNEVAHGIVFPVSELTYFRNAFCIANGDQEWALIPPYYHVRKHANDGAPAFAYASKELITFQDMLYELMDNIKSFRAELLKQGYGLP